MDSVVAPPMLLALLTALLVQESAPTASVVVGSNRHVQLGRVEHATNGGRPRGTYLTGAHRVPAVEHGRPQGFEAGLLIRRDLWTGDEVERLEVEQRVLPVETFSQPPLWRFVDTDQGAWVLLGPSEKGVRLVEFPSGEEAAAFPMGQSAADAIAVPAAEGGSAPEVHTLVLEGRTLARGVLRGGEFAVKRRVDDVLAAAFVRPVDGAPATGAYVCLRAETGMLPTFELFAPDDEPLQGVGVHGGEHFTGPLPPWTLRLAAASHGPKGEALEIAVANPSYDGQVGHILHVGLPSWNARPASLGGRPWPVKAHHDSLSQTGYGHTLAFVPDVDGDGRPDVLTSTPFDVAVHGQPNVLCIGSGTGEVLARYSVGLADRIGASVTVALGGELVVATVAPPGFPEKLADVSTLERLRAPTRERAEFERIRRR